MWGVDREAAWASALALQADDTIIKEGEVVRHSSDGRRFLLRHIVNSFAHCSLDHGEGDPNYVRVFPYHELVRPQHINYACLIHSNNTIVDGDSMSTEQIGNKIIEILRDIK